MNKLILIAGASAAGKSRYAKHFGNAFPIPVISKDSVKEVMHDGLQFHATTVEQTQYYGACAYKLLFYFAECLMKSGVDLCLESNFTNQSKDVMLSLLRTYHYESLTVFLNAPLEILHQRFIQREKTEERHPGLSHGIYHDFETYKKVAAQQTEFDLGDKRLEVDVSDWCGNEAVSRYSGKPGVHDASANLRLTGRRTLDLFQRNGIKYVGDGKYIGILL